MGVATVLGGAEGHAAIIARALGLPAISGVGALTHGIRTGDTIIIDGRKGEIVIRPDAETLHYYRQEVAKKKQEDKRLKTLRDVPALTVDGKLISLQANMELPRDLVGLSARPTAIWKRRSKRALFVKTSFTD